jgi:serine/threonine-protein kinase
VLPARIGRYEVLGQLAAGGMAEILLARLSGPADFKRAVVIKRILRSYAANEAFVRMFLDEARIVASLRHPNVVHVQELGEHDGEAFLVMEYVAGENAASLLKRCVASGEPLDPRLAAHLVAEVCAGLHAAHDLTDDDGRPQNLVHRDVSPQNVLVGYDGHVKLVDFGVALVDRRGTRTEPGEVKGKFDYMSPEQGLGKPLDRRSDLFSLGIVLYELSTGRRLFKRPSAAKSIEAICREPIVPPSRAMSGSAKYPPKLEAIVMRALAKDPAARYATAAEMRLDLLEAAREITSPVEALADRMRRLFPDRIAEKEDLLRKVREGEGLSHVPAGETDENVDVPVAPEATLVDTDPRLAAVRARRWRNTTIAVAASAVVVVTALALAVRGRGVTSTPSAAPPPPPPLATAADASNEEIFVHVETRPAGARVLIGGQDRGETPIELLVARGNQPLLLELERQGYAKATQQIIPDADQKVLVGLTPLVVNHRRPATRPTKAPRTTAPTSSAGFRRFD